MKRWKLGYPSEVYTYGSQVFLMTLLGIVTTPIAIFIFVKVMYDLKLTSAYKVSYVFDPLNGVWQTKDYVFIYCARGIFSISNFATTLLWYDGWGR